MNYGRLQKNRIAYIRRILTDIHAIMIRQIPFAKSSFSFIRNVYKLIIFETLFYIIEKAN